jgi:hypothetical protein
MGVVTREGVLTLQKLSQLNVSAGAAGMTLPWLSQLWGNGGVTSPPAVIRCARPWSTYSGDENGVRLGRLNWQWSRCCLNAIESWLTCGQHWSCRVWIESEMPRPPGHWTHWCGEFLVKGSPRDQTHPQVRAPRRHCLLSERCECPSTGRIGARGPSLCCGGTTPATLALSRTPCLTVRLESVSAHPEAGPDLWRFQRRRLGTGPLLGTAWEGLRQGDAVRLHPNCPRPVLHLILPLLWQLARRHRLRLS